MSIRSAAKPSLASAFRGLWLVICAVLALSGPSCKTDPITGRKSLQLIPTDTINQMGADAYQQILAESKLSDDAQARQSVERVGRAIAAAVDRHLAEKGEQPFQWEFRLIEDPQVNAFCLPGGKVAFYTGILPVCRDEAGIAVVMGHEVAHAFAGHGNSRMSLGVVQQYGLAAVQLALSGGEGSSQVRDLALAALGVGGELGARAFGRNDESHADRLGLTFMAEAGYDPRAAVEFWKRMQSLGGQAPPEFLSTHPSHERRIQDIEEAIPEVLKSYRPAGTAAR